MPPMRAKNGLEVIQQALETMPSASGVYRMLDAEGEPLYIGKAKNLKKRVTSYTHLDRLPYRLKRMVMATHSMEVTTTRTEAEALLLEANLIKSMKPRYNIMLRDDKSFPYIMLTGNHDFPRIAKHRGKRKPGFKYFGPYASAGDVNRAITILQKAFLLRPCQDSFFKNRTRPCMEYQIKRCSAPCVGYVDKENYAELVDQAVQFLSGKRTVVQEQLEAEMEAASSAMQYEKAAIYRDRIQALAAIQAKQSINAASLGDADIISLYSEGDVCCVMLFFIRGGYTYGTKAYFPKST